MKRGAHWHCDDIKSQTIPYIYTVYMYVLTTLEELVCDDPEWYNPDDA